VILVLEKYAATSVRVEVEVEKLFTPMRHGIWGDNRELGVMLSLADVIPAPNSYRAASVHFRRLARDLTARNSRRDRFDFDLLS
jgi:hypothetical protein